MRLLLIDPDPARAALVAEGLAGMGPIELRRLERLNEAELAAFKPDLVVIACDSPDRDTLEGLREATQNNPRPVVMFVDRSEPGLAEEAVQAGVAAYIVDGLQPARVRPILEIAMSRFQLMQQLRADLAKAQSDQIGEEEAYAMLRKLAMNTGRSVGAVAADLLSFHGLLKGDKP
jgi:two-component system, response regulator / RNA-binding antiterminator